MSNNTVALGIRPDVIRIHLTTGADFDGIFRLSTPWPTGTTLTLAFGNGTTWTATIGAGSTDAVFAVDKATADTVPHGTTVKVKYVNGTTDQTWFKGTVVRHD